MAKITEAENETRELRSFVSYLHMVLVKILRDGEKSLKLVVPRLKEGMNLVITVESVPIGMKPPDHFFKMDQAELEFGMVQSTFSPTDKIFDDIQKGKV